MSYPEARRLDLTEDIFGHQVSDPYRWMEDTGSAERADWLRAQAALFSAERAHWPGRDILAERVRELLNVGVVGTPAWRGERSFFTRREPGQEHAVLCTQAAAAPVEVLVDPMAIDPSGLTTLDAWQPDKEGRLLAYQLSEGGDEESLLRVLDVGDRFGGGRADRPVPVLQRGLAAGRQGLLLHAAPAGRFGPGRARASITGGSTCTRSARPPTRKTCSSSVTGRDKTDYYYASVSRDGRWLFLSASRGTAPRNDLFLADLSSSDPSSPELQVVQEGVDAQTSVRAGRDGLMYVFTDLGAPRGRIAVADPGSVTDRASWRDLLPEDAEAVLRGYAILDGAELARPVLLASWTRHALSEITVHDLGSGDVAGFGRAAGPGHRGRAERAAGGRARSVVRVHGLHHAAAGAAVRRADSFSVQTWAVAPGSVAVPAVTARQVTYQSVDGTSVRMLVISGASRCPSASRGRPC